MKCEDITIICDMNRRMTNWYQIIADYINIANINNLFISYKSLYFYNNFI